MSIIFLLLQEGRPHLVSHWQGAGDTGVLEQRGLSSIPCLQPTPRARYWWYLGPHVQSSYCSLSPLSKASASCRMEKQGKWSSPAAQNAKGTLPGGPPSRGYPRLQTRLCFSLRQPCICSLPSFRRLSRYLTCHCLVSHSVILNRTFKIPVQRPGDKNTDTCIWSIHDVK